MIIALEGADKSGKSTLAKELSVKLGWPVIHFGKPGTDPAREYAQFLLNQYDNVICDRFYAGELVYGPLLRGKYSITASQKITIERLCRTAGMILVHVDPSYDTVKERFEKLGDDLITMEQNRQAHRLFRIIVPQISVGTVIKWDQETFTYKIIQKIEESTEFNIKSNEIRKYCSGIGTVVGEKIVFVGDIVNNKTTWLGLPFDRGMSAEYLQKALVAASIDENLVYVTNANTITVHEVWCLISSGPTRFISLGSRAYTKLQALRVKSEKVTHPGYWRRFHFHDSITYSKSIHDAIRRAPVYGTTPANV